MKQLEVLNNYAKAVSVGAYDLHASGLFGKYDNVRRYWEDRYTRNVLSQFLGPLIAHKQGLASGLRVLDLGCGAGEGMNILTTLPQACPTLDEDVEPVLSRQDIHCYKGVDLSPAMIEKAIALHADNPHAEFGIADLNQGLPTDPGEPAYDIYFSSYGALSHLNDAALGKLVGDICAQMDQRAVFVADLLGRYSYEWPCYWKNPGDNGSGMNTYSMSYIYPPETRESVEVDRFAMRYWGSGELDQIITQIATSKGVQVSRRRLCDRSILVGRHMDTQEFNPQAPALRAMVNSLHEPNQRTDLSQLIFTYEPDPEHPHLNQYFSTLQQAWNEVVYACIEALEQWRHPQKLLAEPSPGSSPMVQAAVRTLRTVVQIAPSLRLEDPRANLVEPQLAYLLRDLEWNLQQGLGSAHGLLALYEFQR